MEAGLPHASPKSPNDRCPGSLHAAGLSSGIPFRDRACVDDSTRPLPADASAHASSTRLARAFSGLTSAFGWLMCTLATGAVAAFASMLLDIRPCWAILILALPLTLVLKLCGCMVVRWAAVMAATAILLAGFYAVCLVAIARIAAATGFPFGQAFRVGGIGLTLQVAELGLDAASILVYAGAAVVAAAFAVWLLRGRQPGE